MITVMKHDKSEEFNSNRIRNAIIQAANQISYPDFDLIDSLTNKICRLIMDKSKDNQIEVKEIENTVMSVLYSDAPDIAREYSSYKMDKERAKENPTEVAINEMQEDFKVLENISDRREWFITYKSIISKYSEYIDQPENIYDYFTQAEINMFFKVVQAEIGDEYTFEQKCNVASVILNRLYSDEFENEMFKILTPSQFETIANGRYKKVQVSEDTILACEYVFMFGDTTNGALFFDSNNALKYNKISSDGAHNFYK